MSNRFTYQINPRSDDVGGGYQLQLMEDGQEIGGGVFPVTSDTSADEAYVQASDWAEEWLQSSELDVDAAAQLDDAMIDIETAGKKPGAAVLSIGAVMFGAAGLGQDFYSPVLLQSCTDVGLTIDPSTIAWWMKQSDEARAAAFVADAPPLRIVLQRFTDWLIAQNARYPWCHGATFDVPILDAAYEACGMPAPWKFYDVRDTRTLYDLAGVKVDRSKGTHHNALDDARTQAEAAVKALNVLKGPAYVTIDATADIKAAFEEAAPRHINLVSVTSSPDFIRSDLGDRRLWAVAPDDAFAAAVDAEHPLPDNPHASVIQRVIDSRAAMWRGINVARRILSAPALVAQGEPVAWQNTGDPSWIKVGGRAPDDENWLPLVRPKVVAAPVAPLQPQHCSCPSGDGSLRWPCPAHPPEMQQAEARWTKRPPIEQGDYWHWTGDEEHAPMIYHVMWSGMAKKCFLSVGQYDITEAIWCDAYDGWWMRIDQPSTAFNPA